MEMPRNEFKRRLAEPGVQYGMWVSLADPVAAEITASAGFDWMLIDAEHSPNDLRTLLAQLQAAYGYPVSPVIRPPRGQVSLIKQYLDIGAQTVLIPMVETADQAAEMVAATRYPPAGVRGVATARSARWGRVKNYWHEVDREMCVLVQVETIRGVANLREIAMTDGVDGVFIGPSDLGAALGHLGDASNPEVVESVCESIAAVRAFGKRAGVLSVNPVLARRFRDAGATFVAVGVDTQLLAKHTADLIDSFRRDDDG
ncbi:MAG: aldolase/citrate lyase family protein [Actinomycetota bacterium]